jgi:hypothetical protein
MKSQGNEKGWEVTERVYSVDELQRCTSHQRTQDFDEKNRNGTV